MSENQKVNRREFIRTAGAGAAATALAAGLDVKSALAAPPAKWDEETDVLVVGYGGAGAVTAITAADAGAQVTILEKNPADAHICNTNLNGGQFISPTDVEKGYQYIKACIGDTVDDEMCHLWSELTTANREYIMQLAKSVNEETKLVHNQGAEFPELPGADGISTWNLFPAGGWYIFKIYNKCVKQRKNIKVAWGSPAKRIVQDPNTGEVLGIICERNGKEVSVKGRRATVLTCGGYEFNQKLKLNSLFGNPRNFYGTESNTGDGVVMAMVVGADMWHMNWTSQHMGFGNKFMPSIGGLRQNGRNAWMIVDQYGKRFFNEDYNGHSSYLYLCQLDPVKASWARLPCYFICDESVREKRLVGGAPAAAAQPVPQDTDPIEKAINKWRAERNISIDDQIEKGWIMKGATIPDLVKAINARQQPNAFVEYPSKIKMEAAALQASVDRFNDFVKNGKAADFGTGFEHNPVSTPEYAKASSPDKDFGRRSMALIEKPPYYAMEIYPCGPNTQGGPRFDTKGRVLNVFGKPIPRLYKCGELGSIYGQQYPAGGGNNAEIMAYGRLVGKEAAKEAPHKS